MAYVLLLDKWERQALADRQALITRGVTDDLPSLAGAQAKLDAALEAEPQAPGAGLSVEEYELRVALGVA